MRRFGILFVFFFYGLSTYGASYDGLVINELLAANASIQLETPSYNFISWIELYNPNDQPADIKNCYFSDDRSNPKKFRIANSLIINPKSYRLFWCDGQKIILHTGVKLHLEGGFISLYSPLGKRIDEVAYESQLMDISYGRKPDGYGGWNYFSEPTPAKSNTTDGAPKKKRAESPFFSLSSGIYKGTQPLELSVKSANATIMYTTDGSIPTTSSILYNRPFVLSTPRVIRARTFEKGKIASPVVTNTYIINATHTIPILSLSTNPAFFKR